jgi:hypothetical protein
VIFTSLVLKPFIMLIATTPETSWCSAATTSPKSMAFSSLRVGGGGRVGQGRAAIAGKGGGRGAVPKMRGRGRGTGTHPTAVTVLTHPSSRSVAIAAMRVGARMTTTSCACVAL